MPMLGGDLASRFRQFLADSRKERETLNEVQDQIIQQLALAGAFSESLLTTLLSSHSERSQVIDYVLSCSEAIEKTSIGTMYTLKDSVRRHAFGKLGPKKVRSGILRDRPATTVPVEGLIREIVKDSKLPIDAVQRYGAQAVGKALFICKAILPTLPSLDDFLVSQKRIDLEKWVGSGRDVPFVDRKSELSLLIDTLHGGNANPIGSAIVEINGAAGTGKTELIRQALLKTHSEDRLLAIVDFERPITKSNVVKFIAVEILDAILSTGSVRDEHHVAAHELIKSENEILRIVSTIASLRKETFNEEKSLVVILDSFEMFFNEYGDVLSILDLLDELINSVPHCTVVIGNRLSGFLTRAKKTTITLENLTESDVRELCQKQDLTARQIDLLLRMVPSFNPLLLSINMQYVKLYHDSADSVSPELIKSLNDANRSDYVYRRVIDKLSSPLVRRIAEAAIPLRRVSKDIFADIIAPEIGAGQIREFQIGPLFEELRRQVILFDLRDGDLYLRPDLRRSLLAVYNSASPEICYKTRRRLYQYLNEKCSGSCSGADKVDLIYYALCLKTPRATLEKIWDPEAATELMKYLDDFGDRNRAWLKHKAGIVFTSEDFDASFKQDFVAEIHSEAERLFSRGRSSRVIELIERKNTVDRGIKSELSVNYLVGLAIQFQHNWIDAIETYSELLKYARPDDPYGVLCVHNLVDCYIFMGKAIPKPVIEAHKQTDLERLSGENWLVLRAHLNWLSTAFKIDRLQKSRLAPRYAQIMQTIIPMLGGQRFRPNAAFDEFILLWSRPCPELVGSWGKYVNFRVLPQRQRHQIGNAMVRARELGELHGFDGACAEIESNLKSGESLRLSRGLADFFDNLPKDYRLPRELNFALRRLILAYSEIFFPYIATEGLLWGTKMRPSDIRTLQDISGRGILNFKSARRSIVPTFRRMAEDGRTFDLIEAFSKYDKKFAHFSNALSRWLRFTGTNFHDVQSSA